MTKQLFHATRIQFVTAAIVLFLAVSAQASAQNAPAALPTAPGADRAVNGGLTQAHASLPGGPDRSPLEPYLVLWLLPLSGLLTVAAGVYVDRQVLARSQRRR